MNILDLNVARIRPDVNSYTLGLHELGLALERMKLEFACLKEELAKHMPLVAEPHPTETGGGTLTLLPLLDEAATA